MSYCLGVDLGTTYTAAAIHRGDRTAVVDLGTRTASIPSVVFLRDDETILTGDAANRRGATEPGRVAREFKRRLGDTTPILLGGAPYSANALMSKLLRWVVDAVSEREGAPPERVAVAHPANWGPYKLDLLRQAIVLADLDDVVIVTEPEAAVIHYATQERVPTGAVIAVYDLGGGTFDAAVVRKTDDGVELLGTPEGIERLGGIDFDEAVFSHVAASLGGALDRLDPDDPAATAAVARLRAECVDAKEALSADTEVSIPVLLPNVSTEVRLTRAEFEAMIRPPLTDTLVAVRRALRSAGVAPEDLTAVLLAGGSSRIPLVAQLVGAELGRPVAVDAHPKHGVALGAALVAAGAHAGAAAPTGAAPVLAPIVPAVVPVVSEPAALSVPPDPDLTMPPPEPPESLGDVAAVEPTAPLPPTPPPTSPPPAPPTPSFEPAASGGSSRRWLVLAAVAAVVLVGLGALLLLGGGDDEDQASGAGGTDTAATGAVATEPSVDTTADAATTTAATAATTTDAATTTTVALPCPPEETRLCIAIDALAVDGDSLVVDWSAFNFDPDVESFHAHFFWNDQEAGEAGTNAGTFGFDQGAWELTDQQPFRTETVLLLSNKPPGADGVCVTAATAAHEVVDPTLFHCVPLPA